MDRAVLIAKIATGEVDDERDERLSSAASEMGRRGGKKRAENMTLERRAQIAKAAAIKRWNKQASSCKYRGCRSLKGSWTELSLA